MLISELAGGGKTYDLFISHAWDYSKEYRGIVNLLNSESSFTWRNLSVPKEQPLAALAEKLSRSHRSFIKQLDEKIKTSDCLLVIAGMWVAHRGWIQSEIEAAKEFGKPILAIAPQGQDRLPEALMHAADEEVRWNSQSIIAAVRRVTVQNFEPAVTFEKVIARTTPSLAAGWSIQRAKWAAEDAPSLYDLLIRNSSSRK